MYDACEGMDDRLRILIMHWGRLDSQWIASKLKPFPRSNLVSVYSVFMLGTWHCVL